VADVRHDKLVSWNWRLSAGTLANGKESFMTIGERIRHEVREIGLVTLYFLSCFLFFLSLKKLFLEQYHLKITIFRTAVIGALVVAKVVVLLEKTSFGNRFRSVSLFAHVLWRSLCYTAIVFLVTLAERLFHLYRESSELSRALSELWAGRDFNHFMAMNLCLGFSFLIYNCFSEIDHHLGEGGLRRLFFTR
jgi:hypothetical protein